VVEWLFNHLYFGVRTCRGVGHCPGDLAVGAPGAETAMISEVGEKEVVLSICRGTDVRK